MQILESFNTSIIELSQYLVDPSQRLYWVYLLGSLLLTIPVFFISKKTTCVISFFKFLFPKKIWLHPSARQDYILLIINKIIRGVLLAPAILAMVPIALGVTDILDWLFGTIQPISQTKWIIMTSFTLLLFLLDDLSRFLLHLALHKVPVLWEFHKVHHSAKVLTPFTIYRSHPLENYLFACRLALAQGIAIGIAYFLFGATLSVVEIAGANIFVFTFNFMGSNLRHSHVWLSWGEKLEHWFISPAQHQIHHSDNPIHFDQNLGSALAIWDRMLGILITAKQVNRINFGVGRDFSGHDTVLGIYYLPFVGVWQKVESFFIKIFTSKNETEKN